jgi:hypothetical protein
VLRLRDILVIRKHCPKELTVPQMIEGPASLAGLIDCTPLLTRCGCKVCRNLKHR